MQQKSVVHVLNMSGLQFLRRVVDVEHKLMSLSAPFEATPNYETDARAH